VAQSELAARSELAALVRSAVRVRAAPVPADQAMSVA
jgi:hypothetical protein